MHDYDFVHQKTFVEKHLANTILPTQKEFLRAKKT